MALKKNVLVVCYSDASRAYLGVILDRITEQCIAERHTGVCERCRVNNDVINFIQGILNSLHQLTFSITLHTAE